MPAPQGPIRYCEKCRYYQLPDTVNEPLCNRPVAVWKDKVEYIYETGEKLVPLGDICRNERFNENGCSPSGEYYQP